MMDSYENHRSEERAAIILSLKAEIERLTTALDMITGKRDILLTESERIAAERDKWIEKAAKADASNLTLYAENKRLRVAMHEIVPYKDCIICYASTCSEHEGNRVSKAFDDALNSD